MFWEEKNDKNSVKIPDDLVDILFRIDCKRIPADHAQYLSDSIRKHLPWFENEEESSLHLVHISGSPNGWLKDKDKNTLLYPSRRSRLELRIPSAYVQEAIQQLDGIGLDVGQGCILRTGKSTTRKLVISSTLFTRHLLYNQKDENEFLQHAVDELKQTNIYVKKALCGMESNFIINGENIRTKRLLIADLEPKESLLLQRKGLGDLTKYGLGVFIPHKGIAEVEEAAS